VYELDLLYGLFHTGAISEANIPEVSESIALGSGAKGNVVIG
jgi:hypothetical protein